MRQEFQVTAQTWVDKLKAHQDAINVNNENIKGLTSEIEELHKKNSEEEKSLIYVKGRLDMLQEVFDHLVAKGIIPPQDVPATPVQAPVESEEKVLEPEVNVVDPIVLK